MSNRAAFIRHTFQPPKDVLEDACFLGGDQPVHEVISNLQFLSRVAGVPCQDTRLELWTSRAQDDWAKQWLGQRFGSKGSFALVHPGGGGSPLRQWPIARYSEIIQKIAQAGWNVLLIGGPEERPLVAQLNLPPLAKIQSAVGLLSLGQLAAVLKQADLFVGPDSGPLHMATAAGIPAVGIYGPGSETRFGAYGENTLVVSLRYPCAPDGVKTYEACCRTCQFETNRCLTELAAEQVWQAVQDKISRPAHLTP